MKIGDRVRTGVFVAGEWRPSSVGIVVAQSPDKTLAQVDIGSLHGAAPWLLWEQESHLRLEPEGESK